MLDISFLSNAVECTAQQKSVRKAGAVTITRSAKGNNGHIRLPKVTLQSLQGVKSVGVSTNGQYLVIYAKEEGKNIHELRLEKSGAAVIYNVDLVDELAQRFKLDFSTSPTLHFSEWEPIDGAQAVAIKVA